METSRERQQRIRHMSRVEQLSLTQHIGNAACDVMDGIQSAQEWTQDHDNTYMVVKSASDWSLVFLALAQAAVTEAENGEGGLALALVTVANELAADLAAAKQPVGQPV